jgi:cardiolipin synthase A/B
MVPFKGYGRLTRSTTLALLTTAAILAAEWADLLPDNVMLAVRTGCQIYVLLRVMRARISPAYLLLWGPLAWFFPLPTALLIFVFGGRKHVALADAKKEVNRVAWRLSDEPDFGGNHFRLLGDRDGRDTLAELRRQINGARRRISLSTYILSDDAVGREIVSLLTARAKAGVEVRLLVDAIGSFGIPLRLCRPLRRAGGQIARFNPALPMRGKGSANWRNHRKIAVFDGKAAIIGGQNLGLRYMGDRPSSRRFRDCSFLIEGPTAAAIERVFIADWCQATDEPPMSFASLLRERCAHVGPARVEVIASGPDCEGDPLWETYEKLFSNCKRSITVVTPYLVPDRTLFTLLITAAHAGRHVKIMVPRRSDHRLLDLARRWYLRTLREAGAEILFFKPDVLHAKLVVVDGEQLVIGSANLDMRSLFLNYEIAAVVRDPAALAEVGALITGWEGESTRYTEDLYRRSRTWTGRAIEAVAKVLSPLL